MARSRCCVLCLLVLSGLCAGWPGRAWAAAPEELAERARQVLRKHCLSCHGEANPEAGLKILNQPALLERQLVKPKAPDDSELLQLVEVGSMPPGRLEKVSPAQQQVLREW